MEDFVIYQSNNVGSPITFFVSFSCFLFVQFDNSMNVVNYKMLGIKIIAIFDSSILIFCYLQFSVAISNILKYFSFR